MTDRFTAKAKQAITLAVEAAESLGHNYVGTEHLLLGLIQEGTGVASRVLLECGVEEEKVLELVSQLLTSNSRVSGCWDGLPTRQERSGYWKTATKKRCVSGHL